ncbi:MAG TPA: hypothetical protein VLY87_05725, partial [Flavobacterium sp.]|nr:hypothetical protein [Flavobacterium sp.]
SSFPKKITGSYHNYENNADLIIENQTVLLKYHFQDTLNKSALTELQKETEVTTNPFNDSLFIAKYTITDTLFDVRKGDVIRKWKGHYFLNSQNEQNNWEVQKLTYKNQIVSINDIIEEESLLKLDEITDTPTDTIRPKTYTLSKKQFKEFVKQNGFSEQNSYIKQK